MSDQWTLSDGCSRTDGPAINRLSAARPSGVSPSGVFTWTYSPPAKARIKSISFSGANVARCDLLIGTTGEQALFHQLYITPTCPNACFVFEGYFAINSSQTLQANLWNTHSEAQDLSVCFQIVES